MSFPALGSSLGAAGGSRRPTQRVRTENVQADSARSGGGSTTNWIHPKALKAIRARERAERQEEAERLRDATFGRASALEAVLTAPFAAAASQRAPGDAHLRLRSNSKTDRDAAAGQAILSPALLQAYAVGRVVTLNRKVGRVAYIGPLAGLEGAWVCVSAYRPHGVGRKAIFDFNTVRHERRADGTLVVVEAPIQTTVLQPGPDGTLVSVPSSAMTARSAFVGVGAENYDLYPGGKCEVDVTTIARAQREVAKLLGGATAACPGDHAVFVRVEDAPKGVHPHAHAHAAASPSSSGASGSPHVSSQQRLEQPTLLPALMTSPRMHNGASTSAAGATPANGPITPAAPKEKSKEERHEERRKRRKEKEAAAVAAEAGAKPAAETKTQVAAPSAATPAPPVAVAESKTDSAPSIAAGGTPSPIAPPSAQSARVAPSGAPSASTEVVVESEQHLSVLARRLHLTGPYSVVDALALTAPASCTRSLFGLARYLATSFPAVTNGEEMKARALFRWVCHHISMLSNPLEDKLAHGAKPDLSASGAGGPGGSPGGSPNPDARGPGDAAQGAKHAADEAMKRAMSLHGDASGADSAISPGELPSVEALVGLAKGMHAAQVAELDFGTKMEHMPATLDGSAQSATAATEGSADATSAVASSRLQSSLNAKAAQFQRMELGFGPSSKKGGARKKRRTVKALRRRGSTEGVGGGSGDGGFMSGGGFDSAGFLSGGYSTSEDQQEDDDAQDEAVDAVMKRNLAAAAAAQANKGKGQAGKAGGPDSGSDAPDLLHPAASDSEPISADSVLRTRSSTPYGFAVLFQALAAIAGLECLILRGLVKYGPEYRRRVAREVANLDGTSTTMLASSPHDHELPTTGYSEWNLVRIEGRWALVDCFAASGVWDVNYTSGNNGSPASQAGGKFVRSFSPAYFAPPPETFVLSHYPLFVLKSGVEVLTSVPGGPGKARKYRTVLGNNVTDGLITLNRFGKNASDLTGGGPQVGGLGGFSTKDPLSLSSLELTSNPRALQLLQPPVTKAEFDSFVCTSRLYLEGGLDTYETEYLVSYGINALGGGVAGSTFTIELEVPVWMEASVEMTSLSEDHEASERARQVEALAAEADAKALLNEVLEKAGGALSPASPTNAASSGSASSTSAAGAGGSGFKRGHSRHPSFAPTLAAPKPTATAVGAGGGNLLSVDPTATSTSSVVPSRTSSTSPRSNGGAPSARSSVELLTGVSLSSSSSTMVSTGSKKKAPEWDLTNCWSAQKAVGARLEIRPGGGGSGAAVAVGAGAGLQRNKKTQHRTRMKIHLVFPASGHYRVIIFCRNADTNASGGGGMGSGARESLTNASTLAAANTNPDAIGLRHDSNLGWTPLMEYLCMCSQGVEDLPRPERSMPKAIAAAPVVAAAASAAAQANATQQQAGATNADGTVSTTAVTAPLEKPAPPPASPRRHLYVGFLQHHKPTFAVPSIRALASQVVCVKPWTGYWELGVPFQVQYVTSREVVEMVLVTDGKWSAMNQGPSGYVPSRYPTTQSELLGKTTSYDPGALAQYHESSGASTGRSKAPLLAYQQGQERNVFTLDWLMPTLCELMVYVRIAKTYYLLAYLLPTNQNYVPERPIVISKAAQQRAALLSGVITPADPDPASQPELPPPVLESKWFLTPSGVAFEVQLRVVSAEAKSGGMVELVVDVLRDTELRVKIEEGHVYGRLSRVAAEHLVPENALVSESVRIDELLEPVAPVPEPQSLPPGPPIPRGATRPPSTKPPSQAQASSASQSSSSSASASLARMPLVSAPHINPLHQRMLLRVALPPPNSIQNASSTKQFTLLLYAWSKSYGQSDVEAGTWSGPASNSGGGDQSPATGRSPGIKNRNVGAGDANHTKMFRLLLSYHTKFVAE